MFLKTARWTCVAASLLIVAGCDMKALVKKKVPEPLKNLLSFGPTQPGAVKGPAGIPQPPRSSIVQPAPNAVYPVEKEVIFRGAAEIPGEPAAKPDLTWTLYKDKAQQGIPLGKGLTAKKALEAGAYRAEFSMMYQGHRVLKSVRFRVVYSLPGKVITLDGKGLARAEIILSSLDQKNQVFSTASGPDGSFSVELPPEGHFVLAPRMKGFSFNPFQRIVHYRKDAAAAEFTAVKAELKEIRLTASADSQAVLTSLCPDQDACIKFAMESQDKPERVEAFLARIVSNSENLTQLDEVKGTGVSAPTLASTGPQVLRIKVPTDLRIGPKEVSYRVVVSVRDEKGTMFSAQGRDEVKVDLPQCLAKFLEEAVALHRKGDLQSATVIYNRIGEINKKMDDQASFVPYMEKTRFNRAVAEIGMAVALPEDDARRREYLGKALSDLSTVLKVHKKDVQALLLRGITKQIMGDPESSLGDFSAVLSVEPKTVTALEYRAKGLIKTRKKKNLSQAVDDLTEAIDLEPSSRELRKMRTETLKLVAKSQDEGEESTINISGVPVGEIEKNLTLENYLRK